MNSGHKKVFRIDRADKTIHLEKHIPAYTYGGSHSGGYIYGNVNQKESVPYEVKYVIRIHGYGKIWAAQYDVEGTVAITFAPGETGTKSKSAYVADPAWWTESGTSWVRMDSVTLT